MWQYLINFKQISIVNSEKFALKMKRIKQVFAVMLLFPIKINQSVQITVLRELTDFQNVIITEKELMLPLHETAVHYINMKN